MTAYTQTARPSGCAAMLDPITLNRAARQAFGNLDAGTALFAFVIALIFTLTTGAIWWQYDLASTWLFTQGINTDVQPIAGVIADQASKITDMSMGQFIGSLIVVGCTLLPSLIELIAPRVMHPGVQLALNLTILFDFITDWPTSSAMVSKHAVPFGWLGHTFVTALVTLTISLFVQVLFVLGITVLIASALSIVRGKRITSVVPYIVDQ